MILRCSEEVCPYIFVVSPVISVQRTPAALVDLLHYVDLLIRYQTQKQRLHAVNGLGHRSYLSVVSGAGGKHLLFRVDRPNWFVVFP